VYARNVWDLQAFEGRLYIGAGNSSNIGPAVNAGPVPVIRFDPATGLFEKEFTVDDEQIDIYRVLNGRLYIPGHDPRESWEFGNFYRLEDDGWAKHRTIRRTVHTYDMLAQDGLLFAGGSGEHIAGEAAGKGWVGSMVSISEDGGETWSNAELGGDRVYSLLVVDRVVYAAGLIAGHQWQELWNKHVAAEGVPGKLHANIHEFDGRSGFVPRHDLELTDIFPGSSLDDDQLAKIVKPTAFGTSSVYIGATCHNDHQFLPFGLFVATSLAEGSVDVRRAELPQGSRPWDLLVREDTVYVLLDLPHADYHTVTVLASSDLSDWREIASFRSPTFARSLEMMGVYAYFGLGCETEDPQQWRQEELHPATGRILRLRLRSVP
jgi:hypothetical protein